MSDNLQQLVDGMREELRRRRFLYTSIAHPELAEPLLLEIIPDGVTSLVRVRHRDRLIADTVAAPEVIINELYTFLRRCLKEAIAPTPRLS